MYLGHFLCIEMNSVVWNIWTFLINNVGLTINKMEASGYACTQPFSIQSCRSR